MLDINEKQNTDWIEAKDLIQEEIPSSVSYQTWIKPLTFVKFVNGTLYLKAQNSFQKNFLINNYIPLIENAFSKVTNKPCHVEIILEYSEIDGSEGSGDTQPTNPLMLNPNYTFDTFVIGNSNRFAHAACLGAAESPGVAYNPLFLYGGVGLGKTHLMHAIGHFVRNHSQNTTVMYISSENFTNELIKSIQRNKMDEFRKKYRNVDVLLIDDIQFISKKERTQEEFFHTFNDLYESQKQIIISSDKPPQEIEQLEERLRSRFEWGLIADIQPPDLETRIAILREKAATKGYPNIDHKIHEYIATKSVSNIRKLEGALTKVITFAEFSKKEITLALAAESLKDYLKENSIQQVTPESIIEAVCNRFSLTTEQLCSRRRSKDIAYPRQLCMYLMRELTDLSLHDIGNILGGRDHTTVLYAFRIVSEQSADDNELRLMLADLTKKIRGN